MKRVQQGFTLIELMIVVAIVGILAAIALPAYQDYVIRSKMSEGVAALAACKTSVAEYASTKNAWPTDVTAAGCSSVATQYVTGITVADNGVITAATTNTGAGNCNLILTPGRYGTLPLPAGRVRPTARRSTCRRTSAKPQSRQTLRACGWRSQPQAFCRLRACCHNPSMFRVVHSASVVATSAQGRPLKCLRNEHAGSADFQFECRKANRSQCPCCVGFSDRRMSTNRRRRRRLKLPGLAADRAQTWAQCRRLKRPTRPYVMLTRPSQRAGSVTPLQNCRARLPPIRLKCTWSMDVARHCLPGAGSAKRSANS